jgi:hypothetical protein
MKKGSEWFKLLREKEQQEFKENCRRFTHTMEKESDFTSFICSAFEWLKTPQGWDYWNEISERYL